MSGPGGYYNSGNALGLLVGLGVQIGTAPAGARGENTVMAAVVDYFAGSHSAPDPALNRVGDFLSGIGAVGLGIALLLLGDPLLAATSGLLHALGKFGSAFHRPSMPVPIWPTAWPDPFRSAVLASKLPAMLATALALGSALPQVWSDVSLTVLAMPAALLGCYLLWATTDLLLFDAGPKVPPQISEW